MKLKHVILCCGAGLILALGMPQAHAQDTNRPGEADSRRGPPPGGPGRFIEGLGPVFNVLTEEQRASVGQAMRAQREKIRLLESKILEARREFLTTGLGEKFDEDAVRKRAQAVANLEAEIAVLRMEALSRVQPPLSPEQIEKIRNSMPARLQRGPRPPLAPGRGRILSSPDRDENDLPRKEP